MSAEYPDFQPEKTNEECTAKNRVLLWARGKETGTIYIYRPTCGLWGCAGCRKRLQRYWTLRISKHVNKRVEDGYHWQFVTLTSHEKLKTMEATVAVWPNAWNKIHSRLKRNVGGKVQYVLVPEFHKDGRMHAHLLTETYIKQKWWKDNARESGLGYQAKVKEIEGDGSNAVWYVSKYLGKGMDDGAWPKGFRHVRTSQGWPDIKDDIDFKSDLDFDVIARRGEILFSLQHWQLNKFTVYDLTTGKYVYHEGILVDSATIW